MSKSVFNKKTAQKFAVVHRPHDDPNYYDDEASQHVLVPVGAATSQRASKKGHRKARDVNERAGEAKLYGIEFDDSQYDYTQHLKPIGLDPENSVFIPSKNVREGDNRRKKAVDLFVEPEYRDDRQKRSEPLFSRGVAKPEYLEKMQDIPDEIRGFQPDMNPALREVLEALEDDAYVVNEDVEVKSDPPASAVEDEEDLFAELLEGGEVPGGKDAELDEWDIDGLDDFEEQNYRDEMAQFANVDNLETLQSLDVSADVRRFKQQMARDNANDWDSDDGLSDQGSAAEEQDDLGELPSFGTRTGAKKRRERQRKGAKSDVSGFSMSSSAIARTEVMTILDDKYDQVIGSYENYEEEQDEEEYQPFDMSRERADLSDMLDDFLDNYELERGGRRLAKKDKEIDNLKKAADEVSKGKLSARRNKARKEKNSLDSITSGVQSLKF
ncbi:ACR048Cp [Eremothecium gossypii ATCC 10895]|uniref:ACR048Cp n=1 Tax=Eremothecium gossypii (strain ATCC 10895 / CBS 109.51 / FGSC 9923 / NRRL Y-1056) TaxID=284811 RepID=Q75C68_EREGS|nr:ACR048Cp [Eremothecium gossypii ATCC 10895]AAS51275.1 ACR048Cp [Eremothecium gossypii ATCC 10895]AEY95566.1 FACR048Cp [Eremothecium gossypii FDAG1]